MVTYILPAFTRL